MRLQKFWPALDIKWYDYETLRFHEKIPFHETYKKAVKTFETAPSLNKKLPIFD